MNIKSVNYHLWQACNMKCKFCFATFQDVKREVLPKGHLDESDAIKLTEIISNSHFEKITFAGGEPTLCPWLPKLLQVAKSNGITTMIITNGSGLTKDFLFNNRSSLDWVGLSIDSLDPIRNQKIGRAANGREAPNKQYYLDLINLIQKEGYGLKINTVVNRLNINERFTDFINETAPKRWKVMQVLPMKGQNDSHIDKFNISQASFKQFVKSHTGISKDIKLIAETIEDIKSSYVMIDPAGRFFSNNNSEHEYSPEILKTGLTKALSTMSYDHEKFIKRGGQYNW